ncbi:MAG: GNAT family N-acetyltransferase [Burkholderiaceae bacterium]
MPVSLETQIPTETDSATGLPVGPQMANLEPARQPVREALEGHYCRLEPIDPEKHCDDLFAASTPEDAVARFLYLFEYPPTSREQLFDWLTQVSALADPLFYAVVDKHTGRVEGRQALMRISHEHQVIEIGNIYWGPAIAGTRVATEANFLFARQCFDVWGYRRYEWKCNALNAPSRRAAKRFGFQFEGLFRRAIIAKGRTRDTSWYSIIDEDWPALRAAYEQWLEPTNFDSDGVQKSRLSELTSAIVTRQK